MSDLLDELDSLIEQATKERSHFYVASVARRAKEQLTAEREAHNARVQELEQRQEWIDKVDRPMHPDDERPWCGAYLSAMERVKELEADARRYRWLREANWVDDAIMISNDISDDSPESLDKAIDAAIADQSQEEWK